MNPESIKKGMVLQHSLGISVCVLDVKHCTRGKGDKKKEFYMVKCRYQDNTGLFHVHEFFLEELWLNGIRVTHHADII